MVTLFKQQQAIQSHGLDGGVDRGAGEADDGALADLLEKPKISCKDNKRGIVES